MRMVLSCVSYQHSVLKEEWARASRDTTDRAPHVLGRMEKPPQERNGLIYIIDETGSIHQSINMWMPTGIVVMGSHILITGPWGIHRVARDLAVVDENVYTLPWFNQLHSITRTQRGFLVTSTGLDLLVEFGPDGKVVWSWCALNHGLDKTPLGKQRYINKAADHRGSFYSTPSQTTHINSAVELSNGDILATLFHQGMVIYIHRKNGQWMPLLEHLEHPHFVRLVDEDTFTVADTGRGRALRVKMQSERSATVEMEVKADTIWLQDCFYDKKHEKWWLVDGDGAGIVIFDEQSQEYTHHDFDPELRLYSIEPLIAVDCL